MKTRMNFKKQILSVILCIIMLMSCVPMNVTAAESDDVCAEHNEAYDNGFCPEGCYQSPEAISGVYQIGNAGQLFWFASYVNNVNSTAWGKLTKDITVNKNVLAEDGSLNGDGSEFRTWTPIAAEEGYGMYGGTFDGNGKTIYGLYVNNADADYFGLFGELTGTVQNVALADSYFSAGYRVGGIVGAAYGGTIKNCHNSSTVKGDNNVVGGIVGDSSSRATISNCYNSGSVSSSSYYVGGIVGYNYSCDISNCYNVGSVTGRTLCGGIAGGNSNAKVTDCYYLTGSAQEGFGANSSGEAKAEAMSKEAFESGQVAYLLNGGSS